MSKTKLELQQEYTKACLDLGNLVYQNTVMERQMEANAKDADILQQRMRKLSKEASELPTEVELPSEG